MQVNLKQILFIGGAFADGSGLQDDGFAEPDVRRGDAVHSHRERRVASPAGLCTGIKQSWHGQTKATRLKSVKSHN